MAQMTTTHHHHTTTTTTTITTTNLQHSPYSDGIKDFLRTLETSTLHQLVRTATNNKILPDSDKDKCYAINIILYYTENLARFFSYKCITIKLLFQYLHTKRTGIILGKSKQEMIEEVKTYWERSLVPTRLIKRLQTKAKVKPKSVTRAKPKDIREPAKGRDKDKGSGTTNITINYINNATTTSPGNSPAMKLNLTSPNVQMNLELGQSGSSSSSGGGGGGGGGGSLIKSNIFVREFCKWFYAMLNRLQPQGSATEGEIFSPSVFMSDCTLEVCFNVATNTKKYASRASEAFLLLKGVCVDYGLCFVPYIDSGVQAQISPHGLLKLYCLGTLQAKDELVGVFEQEFSLVKCPENKWKIVGTKLNLKQGCNNVPALPQGPVFNIPA